MKPRLRLAIYIISAFVIGGLAAAIITLKVTEQEKTGEIAMSVEEYNELTGLRALTEVIEKINTEGYGYELTAGEDEMSVQVAKYMVESLGDPYARYYTAEEYDEYLESNSGHYSGAGILAGVPDEQGAPVLDVYEDSPAEKAGLQSGDIVTAVDGTSIGGCTLEEFSSIAAGGEGDVRTYDILRGDQKLTFTITYETVIVKRVQYALFKEYTGYIRIDSFTGSCAEEFEEAIKDLTDRGMKSLVIDLRNNPGGGLDTVVSVCDTLLGECTIVSVRGNDDEDAGKIYTSNAKGVNVPIAVIVNGNSASASEIMAAAVQDNGAGMIVGMTTFGKGIVQTTMRIEANGDWLKLTTDAYYTPNGRSIHGIGITPDIEIDLPEELAGLAIDRIDQEDDAQLWAALDYVREQADLME